MALRSHGEVYRVQGVDQLREALDLSWQDIATGVPEDIAGAVLETENDIRADEGREPADSLLDISEEALREHLSAQFGTHELIDFALQSVDDEYIHLVNGTFARLHTIVEIPEA